MTTQKHVAAIVTVSFLLTGCATMGSQTKARMQNPLYAEKYWSDMTEMYVDQLMNEQQELQKSGTMSDISSKRDAALASSKEATAIRKKGLVGRFVPGKNSVTGGALLLNGTLFIGPDFLSTPGPDLHMYLTNMLDPSVGTFPDPTSKDLGLLQSPYADQQYVVPTGADTKTLRTAVVYDATLKRVYGFAQLQEQE